MGVAGAAFATVLSQLLSFIVCMVYMKIHYRSLFINVLHLQFDKAELKKSLKIGTPAMIQQVFVSVGFMSLQCKDNIKSRHNLQIAVANI